jgi:hypothetical protein
MKDLKMLKPREEFADLQKDMQFASRQNHFILYTLFTTTEAIAIIGFRRMGPGIAELFSIASENIYKYKLEYVKKVRVFIKSFPELYGLHKLIFTVEESQEWAFKWAKILGFKKEGYLEGYDVAGNNHHLFGRVV